MKKTNVWELVNKEAESVIKSIEKGEIKTHKECKEYLESVYNWKISDAIESIINVYLGVNNIDIPWDNEQEDKAE